jgi:hypothetical protein
VIAATLATLNTLAALEREMARARPRSRLSTSLPTDLDAACWTADLAAVRAAVRYTETRPMAGCTCGCGSAVKRGRAFVDKEHQLAWMNSGGAREMNALQPLEAKIKGGSVAGREASASGRLREASLQGAARSREIAERYRAQRHAPAPNKELDN